MKHWDLTPKQKITLIREDGHQVEAQFLFRDTVRACFRFLDDEQVGTLHELLLTNDGNLKDLPTFESLARLYRHYSTMSAMAVFNPELKRWRIEPCPA